MHNKFKDLINKENPIILEIGSADGEDTQKFLKNFNDCKLFCFEPDQRNIEYFLSVIKDSRCKLFPVVVGDVNEKINFYQSDGSRYGKQESWSLSGSINKPKDHLTHHPWCTYNNVINIQSITLDSWIKDNNIKCIDLIYADVNGGEFKLIKGGKETFKITKYFYTEFGPDNAELWEGAITKNDILNLLPDFKEVLVWKNNVLLENKNV